MVNKEVIIKGIEEEKQKTLKKVREEYEGNVNKITLAYEIQKVTVEEGIFNELPLDINTIMKDINKIWDIWDTPSIFKLVLDNYRRKDTV